MLVQQDRWRRRGPKCVGLVEIVMMVLSSVHFRTERYTGAPGTRCLLVRVSYVVRRGCEQLLGGRATAAAAATRSACSWADWGSKQPYCMVRCMPRVVFIRSMALLLYEARINSSGRRLRLATCRALLLRVRTRYKSVSKRLVQCVVCLFVVSSSTGP